MMSTRGSLTRHVRAAGKRMTRERELILRVIEENRHLDAEEICRLASRKNPRLNLSTVYRTMALLREMGLVDACPLGEDHDHYEARGDTHHHAVCLGCGRILEIPTDRWIAGLGRRKQFRVTSAKVELLGYCAACEARFAAAQDGRRRRSPPKDEAKVEPTRGSLGGGAAGATAERADSERDKNS
jgi:Fe2+ or Zn2+ uptake regulation protein